MLLLHDHPVLGSAEIKAALADNDLWQQVERIRIVPQPLTIDEMSKLWTTFQTQYRISVAYEVGVILVDSGRAASTPTADLYTTRMEKGVWQPATRYESKLLDSIGLKCRLNGVSRNGLVLGVVSVHDFGKFHTMLFVHYDPASKQWKGPIVEAPFNNPAIDGACPMFTAGGDKMIWSAGYDRGPGPVSTSGGTGSTYDLFWLNTSDIVAYYKAKAGLS